MGLLLVYHGRVDRNAATIRHLAAPGQRSAALVAWEAREGWLTTAIRCRIDGDVLDARSEVQVSRLEVARAAGEDEAKARIGLPLGMIVPLMKDSRGDIRLALPVGGRLSDPRFDFSEAIWSTIRNVAVKAITAPVSWIGRVRYTDDSRIDRIDVDPIPFAPGQATLAPEARERVSRVAAFLGQAPEARMALTPVVSARDRAALRQGSLDTAIERIARASADQKALAEGLAKSVGGVRRVVKRARGATGPGRRRWRIVLTRELRPRRPARPTAWRRGAAPSSPRRYPSR